MISSPQRASRLGKRGTGKRRKRRREESETPRISLLGFYDFLEGLGLFGAGGDQGTHGHAVERAAGHLDLADLEGQRDFADLLLEEFLEALARAGAASDGDGDNEAFLD